MSRTTGMEDTMSTCDGSEVGETPDGLSKTRATDNIVRSVKDIKRVDSDEARCGVCHSTNIRDHSRFSTSYATLRFKCHDCGFTDEKEVS